MAKRVKMALLDRLDNALKNIYHNATLHIPMSVDDPTGEIFNEILERGSMEIEYIQEGLGLTAREWKKEEKLGFSYNERYFWLVSRITEFGEIYQWGRGGRTLAPDALVNQGGGSRFGIKDSSYFEETSNADLTDMIQVIEAFNLYVETWCSAKNILELVEDIQEQIKDREEERLASLCPTCGRSKLVNL